MVCAYLLKYRSAELGYSVGAALASVRESRRCANPRREFLIALERYAQMLAAADTWRVDARAARSEADAARAGYEAEGSGDVPFIIEEDENELENGENGGAAPAGQRRGSGRREAWRGCRLARRAGESPQSCFEE